MKRVHAMHDSCDACAMRSSVHRLYLFLFTDKDTQCHIASWRCCALQLQQQDAPLLSQTTTLLARGHQFTFVFSHLL